MSMPTPVMLEALGEQLDAINDALTEARAWLSRLEDRVAFLDEVATENAAAAARIAAALQAVAPEPTEPPR